jgi:uncharacterized membrane protein
VQYASVKHTEAMGPLPVGFVVAVPIVSGVVFAIAALVVAALTTLNVLTLAVLVAAAIIVGISPILRPDLWRRLGGQA